MAEEDRIPDERISEKLQEKNRKLWRTPNFPGAFTGLTTFRAALALNKSIHVNRTDLFHIMRSDEDFILETKRRRKVFKRRKLFVHGFSSIWQADLAEMGEVRSYKYFLCCIDLFSRNIYCESLKNKTGKDVRKAMTLIFKRAGITPRQIETDRGGEFMSNSTFFKQKHIYFKTKVGRNKAAFAEYAIQVWNMFSLILEISSYQCMFNFRW